MAGAPIYAGTYAARALSQGLTASAGLREFRAAGGGIRTQRWYQMWGHAELTLAQQSAEVSAPLNRVPERGTLPHVATVSKTGIQQRVRVFGIARDGLPDSRVVTVRSQNGVSRAHAIKLAIDTVATTSGTSGGIKPVTGVHIQALEEVPGDTGRVGRGD